ncbi:hypothetical protein ES288_D11G132600v1 [Gossypium darwinii]|uniref:GAG-pre-integrase domain-containing protein n=1 Tax=Gossypium darwinii TaxID=34276 RepID=A0A5D2AKQ3_GOSDA|nr:hypothetical protein ES288_D11G132600v1 [Gossypium darwinii]
MSNLDQNYYESGQNVANGQIWFADGLFHEQKWGPHEIQNVGLNGWPRSNVDEGYVSRPPNYGPNVLGSNHGPNGGLDSGFGPVPDIGPNVVGSNASLLATNPVSNNVQLNPAKPFSNVDVPWHTKPRVRVFLASNPCFGLPRLGDLHASDYSDPFISGSHINSTQHGVSGDGSDSPVPGPVGTSSWYLDSGANIHILILVPAIMCVEIRQHCVMPFHIQDSMTQEILLTGRIHNGLYQFSMSDDSIPITYHSSTAQVEFLTQTANNEFFLLWHKRLGHPSSTVVKNVLNKCRVNMNKFAISDVYTACKKGKFHKLPFPVSTTEYIDPFSLVVLDLWGPVSIASGNHWYYVSFIDMSSRFTWVYLIRQESQAVTCFIHFQKHVQTQFGKTIKQFQSD